MRSNNSANFYANVLLTADSRIDVNQIGSGTNNVLSLNSLTVNAGTKTLTVTNNGVIAGATASNGYILNFAGATTLNGNLVLNPNYIQNAEEGLAPTVSFSGAIGESTPSSVTVIGNGTVQMLAVDTYSGGTTVNNGTLQINGSTGGIAGPLTINPLGNVVVDASGTGNSDHFTGNANITLAGGMLSLAAAPGVNRSETVGTLTVTSTSTLSLRPAALGTGTVNLTASSISNSNNAGLTFYRTFTPTAQANLALATEPANGTRFDFINVIEPAIASGTYVGTTGPGGYVQIASAVNGNSGIIAGAGSVGGITYYSLNSGNFDNPLTWSPNGVPTAADTVVIATDHTIALNGNRTVNAMQVVPAFLPPTALPTGTDWSTNVAATTTTIALNPIGGYPNVLGRGLTMATFRSVITGQTNVLATGGATTTTPDSVLTFSPAVTTALAINITVFMGDYGISPAPAPTTTSLTNTVAGGPLKGAASLVGRAITFTGGSTAALKGQSAAIIAHDTNAGTITFTPALSAAPAAQVGAASTVGDEFLFNNYAVTSVSGTPTSVFTCTTLIGQTIPVRTPITVFAGTGNNQISYVSAFNSATGTITVSPAFATALSAAAAAPSLFAVGGNVAVNNLSTFAAQPTTPTTTALQSPALINIPNPSGKFIQFMTGPAAGNLVAITSYVASTGTITYATTNSTAIAASAAVPGDNFIIYGGVTSSSAQASGNVLTIASGNLTTVPPTLTSGNGMRFETYNTIRNITLVPNGARIEPIINHNGNNATLPAIGGVGQNNMSVWTGFVQPNFTDTYTFLSNVDDDTRVYVNGILLGESVGVGQGVANTQIYGGSISLSAGVKYPLRVEWAQGTGGAGNILQWKSLLETGNQLVVIPQNVLYSAPNPFYIGSNINFGATLGNIANNGGGRIEVNGSIVGSGGLNLSGTGITTLYAPGNFTGGAALNSGGLVFANAQALGSNTFTINGGAVGSGISAFVTNPLNLNGDFMVLDYNQPLTFSGAALLQKNVTVTTTSFSITTIPASQAFTFGGVISDGGNNFSLGKSSAGIMILSAQNTYGGNTIINAGTLRLGIDNAVPPNSFVLMNSISQSVGAAGQCLQANFDLNDFNQTLNAGIGLTPTANTAQNQNNVTNTSNCIAHADLEQHRAGDVRRQHSAGIRQ